MNTEFEALVAKGLAGTLTMDEALGARWNKEQRALLLSYFGNAITPSVQAELDALDLAKARAIEIKTANFTAVVGGRYIVESGGVVSITDPAGSIAGESYEVWIGSGTIWFNGAGTVYSSSRFSIRRRYTGGAWATPAPLLSDNLTLASYTEGTVAIGNSGASKTLDISVGTYQTVTLTANCTFTLPTVVFGKSFTLAVYTGAGAFTPTFTGAKWENNVTPTFSTVASRYYYVTGVCNGTSWDLSVGTVRHV